MDTVTIPKAEYERLRAADRHLDRLIASGVDNWEGYCGGGDEDDEEDDVV